MFDLFKEDSRELLNRDGTVIYYPNFLKNADELFATLKREIKWEEKKITLYGKTHDVPRLSAWYGERSSDYSYSGIHMDVNPWTDKLLEIKKNVETLANENFNGVLCNLYRHGRDYAAWHSDDEKELGENPTIASVSLGEERFFHLKHKYDKGQEVIKINLEHGSVLIMKGKLQHFWRHQLAKSTKDLGPRINLTFRNIKRK